MELMTVGKHSTFCGGSRDEERFK